MKKSKFNNGLINLITFGNLVEIGPEKKLNLLFKIINNNYYNKVWKEEIGYFQDIMLNGVYLLLEKMSFGLKHYDIFYINIR